MSYDNNIKNIDILNDTNRFNITNSIQLDFS